MAGRTKAQRSRQHNPVDTAGSGASWSPHELVELAHEAVLVRDADGGTIRFWNRGAEALYGWSRQEAIGQVSHVLLRTQFPMPLAEIEAQLRATGYWEGELTHTTRDGRRLVVASRWILRRDPAGQGAAFLEFNTDITLRKDAEARAELATLVEAADDAIVRVSVDGTITSWNPGGERLYGYSAAEAVGQPISLLAPADRPDEPAALLTRVRQAGRTERLEAVHRRKDGSAVEVSLSISPVRDAAGQIVGAVWNARDITERNRREEQLRESEERFRATFEQAAVGMAHVGLDGRWLRVNDRLCESVGYSREELLQRTFQDITYPADLEADLEQVQRLLTGEIDTYTLDKRYVRKDGSPVWIALTVALVRQADGTPHYFLGVVQDIDARKQAEEQVRLQAARQALLAEASRAFAAAGLDTRVLLDDIARRVGDTIGDTCVVRLVVEGGTLLEPAAIYHPDPAAAALIQELLAQEPARLDEGISAEVARTGQAVLVAEVPLAEQRRRIKPAYWPFLERLGAYSVLLVPLRIGGRILGTLGVSRDRPGRPYTPEDAALLQELADRAALALEAGRRFDQSVAALRARDDVLGAVSHDLRTPLTAISGSAELLRRRLARAGVVDEGFTQSVERIVGASRRMTRMMEDLVDAARLEAGQPLVLQRAPTDLVALVRATLVEQEATTRQHTLQVSVSDPQLVGDWDAARLRRVLENLLSNAIKYSPRGGEVRVEVAAETTAGTRWAVVRVTDQGLGIPAGDLPHVFERFRRAGNVGGIAGTGIGLAGSWHIVRQHGGTLEVQSEEERGSTFTMRLPLPAGEGETAPPSEPSRA